MLLLSADEALATTAVRRLAAHGHIIEWERRMGSAGTWLKMRRFDLLLMDIVEDAGSGVRLLARLRRHGETTPALMLTADRADDRVLALDLGADDCLAWPSDPAELEARCRALLRRSRGRAADVFQHAGFRFDVRARRAHLDGALLPLPRREFGLLEILVGRFGQAVRRHELSNGLFGPGEHIGGNALELYVSRLRRRLAGAPVRISTVRGIGYRLEPLGPAPRLGAQRDACQTVGMSVPTLLIADDHPLFRAAVMHVLRTALPGARMLEAASAGALGEVLGQHPDTDLVLLDLAMPGARGFSALLHVRGEYPDVPVVVISSNDHPRVIRRAQQFGAAGFISKSAPAEAIGSAVLAVLEGGSAFPPMQAERSEADARLAANLAQLTPQQFRVLLCLADGLLNKQIAHQLGLAENTVKVHVTAILKKLDCYSRTQAAVLVKALEPESAP